MSKKKKYEVMKPRDDAYEELSNEYERENMPDYAFKSKSQAMGKNAKKVKRNKTIRTVAAVVGAILLVNIGYFVTEVVKGVNSRRDSDTTTAITTQKEQTTFPESTTQKQQSGESTYPSQLSTTTTKAHKEKEKNKTDSKSADASEQTGTTSADGADFE